MRILFQSFGENMIFKFYYIGYLSKEHCIRFQDDCRIKHGSPISLNGVAFMVLGHRLMECHQGPQHRKNTSDKVNMKLTLISVPTKSHYNL